MGPQSLESSHNSTKMSTSTSPSATATSSAVRRDSLNGCWILDSTRGSPSMRKYLETMGVDELAIQANEKGELEVDTFRTIDITDRTIQIVKRSRVNNDLVMELTLDEPHVEFLSPGDREKKMLLTCLTPQQVQIESSLLTVNGLAKVTEIQTLLQEEDATVIQQKLSITNVSSGVSHTTIRYFVPYHKTPPHLEETPMVDETP